MKRLWEPQAIAIVMLLWALMPINPYGYYILLRWVCFGVFGLLTYTAVIQSKIGWAWLLGINALIYNPIFRVHLDRELWSAINLVSVVILIISIFIFKWTNNETNEDEESADLYAKAEEEIEAGKIDRGMWSQALVIAKGDEQLRKVEYMKLRVLQLKHQPKRTTTVIKSISPASPEERLSQEVKKYDVQSVQPNKKGLWRFFTETHKDDKAGSVWAFCIMWGALGTGSIGLSVLHVAIDLGWEEDETIFMIAFGIVSFIMFFAYKKLIKERKPVK